MRRRLAFITVPAVVLAVVATGAAATSSPGTGTARSVSPGAGGTKTHVTVRFTKAFAQDLDSPSGLEDLLVKVTSPCSGKGFVRWRLTDQDSLGGSYRQAVLTPPPGGSKTWCRGRWRGEVIQVTINSTKGDCATEDEPEIDENCQVKKTTGRFAFVVR